MALSADTLLDFDLGELNELPVKASEVIYRGSAVGLTSGYARALVAGDIFGGFALAAVTGTAADGGANVQVRTSGKVKLAISALAVTDIDKPVYASADGTFTLTATSNTRIGTVHRWIETGYGIIAFNASGAQGLTGVAALTDSSGGASADGTIGAITTFTPSVAWNGSSVYPSAADATAIAAGITACKDAIKELATKLNEVIAASK